jgi:hypothetical protein
MILMNTAAPGLATQSHKTTISTKLSERQVDLDSKQAELRSVAAVNDALQERVSTQEVNTADVEHMAKEKAHLDELLDAVSAQKDKEEKVVWDREMEVRRAVMTARRSAMEKLRIGLVGFGAGRPKMALELEGHTPTIRGVCVGPRFGLQSCRGKSASRYSRVSSSPTRNR